MTKIDPWTTTVVTSSPPLPIDIVLRFASFLDVNDLCINFGGVSKLFYALSKSTRLWKDIAERTYGSNIVKIALSSGAYGSFKSMVADDMRLVANPTIHRLQNPIPSRYKNNRPLGNHYVCLIAGIQLHRSNNEMRIYVNVRGERDMNSPETCCIAHECLMDSPAFRLRLGDRNRNRSELYVHDDSKILRCNRFTGISNGSQHFKGFVSFDISTFFSRPGKYYFIYDPVFFMNHVRWIFEEAPILELNSCKDNRAVSLEKAFARNSSVVYTVDEWSPFSKDSSDAEERDFFRPFVHPTVWERHIRSPWLQHPNPRIRAGVTEWWPSTNVR